MLCPPRSRYPLNKGPAASIPPVDAAGPDLFSKIVDLSLSVRPMCGAVGTKSPREH